MADCVFCKIAAKALPAHVVYEDAEHLAFLDVNPCSEGQALVVPKKHVGYVFNLGDVELGKLFVAVKRVGKAIDRSLKPVRTCIVVEGFGVEDHIHIRLHPCYEHCLRLSPCAKPSEQEFKNTADKIRAALR